MTPLDLDGLDPEDKLEILRLLELKDRRSRENWLASYRPYPKQKEFHNAGLENRERLFLAANQGHPLDTPILTPSGWRPIGDLAVGDKVMAGDGTECSVTGVVELGERDVYEVVFDQGNIRVPCTDDHLWDVRPRRGVEYTTKTTAELAQRAAYWATPACGPVQFKEKTLPVDPYLLGILVGDGTYTRSGVKFSTNDFFILCEVKRLIPKACRVAKHASARDADWAIVRRHGRSNEMLDAIRRLGMHGQRSESKRVPTEYLFGAAEQRLALLQGLMDADGSVTKSETGCCRVDFWTSSPGLADDVAFLVRSLGGKARLRGRNRREYTNAQGAKRPMQLEYIVGVTMPRGVSPFRLPRKAGPVLKRDESDVTRRGLDHFLDGVEMTKRRAVSRCIRVDHPSSLYICKDFIVTHNCGKTLSAAAEIAIHTTGLYPDWWRGRRFPRATRWMVASESAELTKRGMQRLLVGPPENKHEWGTGAIPKSHLGNWSMRQGVADCIASLTVKNEFGGESVIQFLSYEQGRGKFQADTVDGVSFDEQPADESLYTEALTRTNATGGIVFVTFTPLLGMTDLVRRFLNDKPPGTAVTRMTIDDVDHYTAEQKAAIIASYPAHEREARTRGIPMMGEGMVFPIAESAITCDPFQIPSYWARIGGMDFGIDHPAGFCVLAHDRDTDTIYVTDAWAVKGKSAAEQAMMILGKGYGKMPWAWPHDGLQRDKGSGAQLIKQFKDYGVNTLAERAQFAPTTDGKAGGNGVEAGLSVMLERMQTGRFKVFSNLGQWFEEMRQYHRKDGVVVKKHDDLMCFHPDTEVITKKGVQKIADMVGGSGWVRGLHGGWVEYHDCRRTRRDAELVRVEYSDGSSVTCTPDHLLLSDSFNWVRAVDAAGMRCHTPAPLIEGPACQNRSSFTKAENTTSSTDTTALGTGGSCTAFFTSSQMDQYPKGTTFTTRMGTGPTTPWKISNPRMEGSTLRTTCAAVFSTLKRLWTPLLSGERPTREKSSCESRGSVTRTTSDSNGSLIASAAEPSTSRSIQGSTDFAPTSAERSTDGTPVLTTSRLSARIAAQSSPRTSTVQKSIAGCLAHERRGQPPPRAGTTLSVLAVRRLTERSDTYCMEVPDGHAFMLANGSVAHNCSTRYATMMLRKAQIPTEYDDNPRNLLLRPNMLSFDVFDPSAGW